MIEGEPETDVELSDAIFRGILFNLAVVSPQMKALKRDIAEGSLPQGSEQNRLAEIFRWHGVSNPPGSRTTFELPDRTNGESSFE